MPIEPNFSNWKWSEFGYCTFLNFGKNYAGARDSYVYVYTPDTPSAYASTKHFILMRVTQTKILEKSAYEVFTGMNNGQPSWSSNISARTPVFTHAPPGTNGRCLRSGVTYNAGLKRYLWWQQLRVDRDDTRFEGGFSVYDAPEPWGPWTTVFFTERWDIGPGEHGNFCSKWMSADGREAYLTFSGDDSMTIRKVTFHLDGSLPAPPPAPQLSAPAHQSVDRPLNVTLTWSAAARATSYECTVSTNLTFAQPLLARSGITTTSLPLSGLTSGRTYHWRVRATNAGGTSAWSPTWSFATRANAQTPGAPTLLSPADGATSVSLTPMLTWSSVAGAESYQFQLAGSSSFATLLESGDREVTSFILPALDPDTQYFWRVAALNADGSSPWSRAQSFTTVPEEPGDPDIRHLPWSCDVTKPNLSRATRIGSSLMVRGRLSEINLTRGSNAVKVQLALVDRDPSTGRVEEPLWKSADSVSKVNRNGSAKFHIRNLTPPATWSDGAPLWLAIRATDTQFSQASTSLYVFKLPITP